MIVYISFFYANSIQEGGWGVAKTSVADNFDMIGFPPDIKVIEALYQMV